MLQLCLLVRNGVIKVSETAKTDKPVAESKVKEIDVKGYKFTVDTDRLDDVESLEIIERIENKGQVAAVIPLLKQILGVAEYEKMKAAFSEMDAKDHAKEQPKDKDYKPRMRIDHLSDVYLAIMDAFSPKD